MPGDEKQERQRDAEKDKGKKHNEKTQAELSDEHAGQHPMPRHFGVRFSGPVIAGIVRDTRG
jgi:hypothetical protein